MDKKMQDELETGIQKAFVGPRVVFLNGDTIDPPVDGQPKP